MEDREREYLKENMLRLERWEETPSAPSGRSSDLTEVEKEKLIDLLFANNEKLMSELAGMRSEIGRLVSEVRTANDSRALWQQRSEAAERRADAAGKRAGAVEMKAEADGTAMQEKIDRLLSLVEELRNGNELRAMAERAEKAEKTVADLLAEVRAMRGQAYGTKSQKRRKDDNDGNDGDPRDAQSEKDGMGGRDSVRKLPGTSPGADMSDTDIWVEDNYRAKRAYREGSRNRTMKAARRCVHESDRDAIPGGWTLVREEKRFAYDKMTVIVEHEYRYFVVNDPEGREHVLYLPKDNGSEKWIETRTGEEIRPAAPADTPLRDNAGNLVYLDDAVIDTEHLCCMAHARAKFFYAWQANREPDAEYILRIIQELYNLEEHYEKLGLSPDEIKKMRNGDRTNELVIELRSKIDSMKSVEHPARSEMLEKALRYMDDFWTQLLAYRNDGRYAIDNTIAERFMRPISGERKNSLFYGSAKMAGISSVYRTQISTCRLMKVSVTEYFRKVFRMIVSGYDNPTSLLPMNMGLSVNNL